MTDNGNKRIQSIDPVETYAYRMRKGLVFFFKLYEINLNIMKQIRYNKKKYIKKINIDNIAREDIKEHKPNWQHMPDHRYRILIIRRSWPGKTNALLNLISHLPIINKLIK